MRNAKIGSISHGTLRVCDLLYNFAVEIDYLKEDESDTNARSRMYAILDPDSLEVMEGKDDEATYLLDEFNTALEELAPPYCYFGANEGDDFGFWPCLEAVEDLPKFNDPSEVPEGMIDDYCVVNDHGNVSVYGADGSLIWDCV